MTIEILGVDCKASRLLRKNIEQALGGRKEHVELKNLYEPATFIEYGLLSLPGLVIDGKLRSAGQLLSTKAITSMLNRDLQRG